MYIYMYVDNAILYPISFDHAFKISLRCVSIDSFNLFRNPFKIRWLKEIYSIYLIIFNPMLLYIPFDHVFKISAPCILSNSFNLCRNV